MLSYRLQFDIISTCINLRGLIYIQCPQSDTIHYSMSPVGHYPLMWILFVSDLMRVTFIFVLI